MIATEVGGPNGWRWAFYVLAIPISSWRFIAFRIPEPPRGQFEKKDVLGEVIGDARPASPSLEAAFERIMRIRTIKTVLIAFSAIGFGLFTVPVLGNLYLKQRFGLDAFERGHDRHHRERRGAGRPAPRRAVLRPPLPQGPGARRSR